MNLWLKQRHHELYSELDRLKSDHPSGRDNGRWIAEFKGKLFVCILLMDTPIDNERIEEVERAIDGETPSDVENEFLANYKNGAIKFIGEVTNKLKNG